MSGQTDGRTGHGTRRDGREGPPQPAGVVLSAVRSLVNHQFSAAC
jgi:hypothetical protein